MTIAPGPPSWMPCPVCGLLASVRSVGTAMTDDGTNITALNISEAVVRCDTHGLHKWTPSVYTKPPFPGVSGGADRNTSHEH